MAETPLQVEIAKGLHDGIPVRSELPQHTGATTAGGYRATMADGVMTIHDVPIFVACKRGESDFDEAWINKAVGKARQAEGESYLPPMHKRHHELATAGDVNAVTGVGYFRVLGTKRITFKGEQCLAIMADLIVTDEETQTELLARKYPYRSVEIFDVNKPNLDGLALLSDEAPFLELPMLMISDVRDGQSFKSQPWSMEHSDAGPVAAFFRRGDRARMLLAADANFPTLEDAPVILDPDMELVDEQESYDRQGNLLTKQQTYKLKKPRGEQMDLFTKKVNMADDDKDKDKKDDGNMAEGDGGDSVDASAIIKAITDGSISIDAFNEIKAAMDAKMAEGAAETPEEEDVATAAVPGAEAMSKSASADKLNFAKIKGEIEALRAKDAVRDANEIRTKDVADAMELLRDRPLGSDLEENLISFHKESNGGNLFKTYVESMAANIAPVSSDTGAAVRFAGQNGKVPEVAMKYQSDGTERVDEAARFCAEYTELKAHGQKVNVTQERYVQLNMARAATLRS